MRPPSDIEASNAPSARVATDNEPYVAHYLRAQEHADAERYEEALEELLEAIRLNPKLPELIARVGWSLELWPAEATQAFREATEVPPYLEGAYYKLGRIYTKRRAFEAAAAAFQKAVKINSKFADAHYGLGAALVVLKQIPAGIKAFLNAEEHETDPQKRDIINSTLIGLGFNREQLKRNIADRALAEYNLDRLRNTLFDQGEAPLDIAAKPSIPPADYGRTGVEVGRDRAAGEIAEPGTARELWLKTRPSAPAGAPPELRDLVRSRRPDDARALIDQLSPFLQARAYDKRSEQDPDVIKQMRSAVNRFNYERRKGAQFTEEQTETVAKFRRIVNGHDYHLQKRTPEPT